MDANHPIEIAGHRRNVDRIFNYCDRWCERCLFTDRCFQYQSTPQPPREKAEEGAGVSLAFVAEQFALTREVLRQKMEDLATPVPGPEELSPPAPDADARQARVGEHLLLRAAAAYHQLVAAWFPSEREALCGKAEDLLARIERGGDGEALLMEAKQVHNALEIIEFDRWLVHSKLYRALMGREADLTCLDEDCHLVQNDSNGSAKVALISIERSEAAWRVIEQWTATPETAGLVGNALTQLRVLVEREFPDARRFVRPGFDDVAS